MPAGSEFDSTLQIHPRRISYGVIPVGTSATRTLHLSHIRPLEGFTPQIECESALFDVSITDWSASQDGIDMEVRVTPRAGTDGARVKVPASVSYGLSRGEATLYVRSRAVEVADGPS